MPYLNNNTPDDLLKILAYGLPKTRKSWWAAKIAESGFNVIYLAAEPAALGSAILTDLSEEAKSRIFYMDITDNIDRAICAPFLRKLLAGDGDMPWNVKTKRQHIIGIQKADPEDIITFNSALFDKNTVLVLDPWSNVCDSISKEYDEVHENAHSESEKTDWTGYGWAGRRATFFAQQLSSLNCHTVVIAHEQQYEKRKGIPAPTAADPDKEKMVTEFSRKQIKSISGPHAMTMPGKFSDILYFRAKGLEKMTASIEIDTRLEAERDGGCRNLPPKTWKWEDCSFKNLIKEAGMKLPDNPTNEIAGITLGLPAPVIVKPTPKPVAAATLTAGKTDGKTIMSGLFNLNK